MYICIGSLPSSLCLLSSLQTVNFLGDDVTYMTCLPSCLTLLYTGPKLPICKESESAPTPVPVPVYIRTQLPVPSSIPITPKPSQVQTPVPAPIKSSTDSPVLILRSIYNKFSIQYILLIFCS